MSNRIYTGIPLNPSYAEIRDQLSQNLADSSLPSQAKLAAQLGDVLVGSMMQALIHEFLRDVELKPFARKVMTQVGSITEKTATSIVEKVIVKLPNKDLKTVLDYMVSHELDVEGKLYLASEMDQAKGQQLLDALAVINQGNGEQVKGQFTSSLLYVMELSLNDFFKQPMSLIKLGMIAKKLVDIGYVTLNKASQTAIKKMVGKMDNTELKSMGVYASTLIVEV